MKKIIVAVFIVGTFILYSFLYHSNATAIVPTGTTGSSASTASNSSTKVSPTSVVSTVPGPAATPDTTVTPGATVAPGITVTPGTTATPAATTTSSPYKDGTYTGSVADAIWGNVQVQAVIQNGKITSVQFLQAPNDRGRSIMINSYADPQLSSEAIQAQSANVDIVTGATDSSEAFIQSLTDALSQAKA